MKTIVAVDANWGIGCQGRLLQRIPEDMKQFKAKTVGHVVVMGRETFESLPGRNPLKDRTNIVLSRNLAFNDDRFTICRSLEELDSVLAQIPTDEIFVIGGASVYAQLLPFCSEAYVTRFAQAFTADKHLPNLDQDPSWKLDSAGEWNEHEGIRYQFTRYINKNSNERFGREFAWPRN